MIHSEKASGGRDSPAKLDARVYRFKIMVIRSGSRKLRLSTELSWFCCLADAETSGLLLPGVWFGDLLFDLSDPE